MSWIGGQKGTKHQRQPNPNHKSGVRRSMFECALGSGLRGRLAGSDHTADRRYCPATIGPCTTWPRAHHCLHCQIAIFWSQNFDDPRFVTTSSNRGYAFCGLCCNYGELWPRRLRRRIATRRDGEYCAICLYFYIFVCNIFWCSRLLDFFRLETITLAPLCWLPESLRGCWRYLLGGAGCRAAQGRKIVLFNWVSSVWCDYFIHERYGGVQL